MGKIAAWLFLGVAVFCAYANTLDNSFVFDDYFMVVENGAIRLPLQEWPKIFVDSDGRIGSYRPLRTLSYAIDYQIAGVNPSIYHFFNIVYHWTTAFLVFLVTLQLVTARKMQLSFDAPLTASTVALGIALLWALHPVQTESVAYVSGRRDILAGLFFFLGFYAFLRLRNAGPTLRLGKGVGWTTVAALAFLFGALSKEMVFVLPPVFFVYDLCREHTLGDSLWRSAVSTGWKYKWLYGSFLVLALGGAWYYAPFFSILLKWHGEGPLTTWATVPSIWLHYLKLLLFPVMLNADYSNAFPLASAFFEGRTVGATIAVLLIVAAVLWGLKRGHRLVAFCGLWFVVTLLPVSHVLPHPELVAEHYLYIPSFGFCLLLGLALAHLIRLSPHVFSRREAGGSFLGRVKEVVAQWGRGLGYGLFAALLLFYSVRTVTRNGDWQDEVTLWRKTVETAPNSARAHHNLGVALYQISQDLDAAEQEFRQAIAVDPTYGPAYTGLAEVYLSALRFDDALPAARKGVELRPRRAWARWVLGMVYFRRGEYPQAIAALHKVVELDKNFSPAHEMIVTLYRVTGKEEKAAEWLSRFPPVTTLPTRLIPGGLEGREERRPSS